MNRLTTHLTVNQIEDKHYCVILGRVDSTLKQEKLELYYKQRKITEGFIAEFTVLPLSEIRAPNLENQHRSFAREELFWARMERAYGGGLPGEFEVTFITLTPTAPTPPRPLRSPEPTPMARTFKSFRSGLRRANIADLLAVTEEDE